jgi:thiamine-monophosphate kinase
MPRISDLGEDALVARLTSLLSSGPGVLAGPGDDCAVVEGSARGEVELLKTDCLVEGIHYRPNAMASKVGRKAVARTLSDFAAMGGWPRHLLLTIALPPDREVRWVEGLYRGMNKCAQQYECAIVGGETSSLPVGAPVVISVAATGFAKRSQLTMRSAGQRGDLLFVTGRLGGSRKGRHLTFTPRLVEARWLTEKFRVHAMMDLSDGLAMDLPRLAEASGCGFRFDRESVPRTRGVTVAQAIGDGEDYELLFALSPRSAKRLQAEWARQFSSLRLTCIGSLTDCEGPLLDGGWDHFAS